MNKQRGLMLHRKWLSFRALEGRSRAPHELQLQHRPAAHAALGCVAACAIVLCGLNDAPFAGSVHLRGIVQAAFCVVAAGMYCAYMLMSYVLSVVLACAEERVLLHRRPSSSFVIDDEDDDEDYEDDDDDDDDDADDDGCGTRRGAPLLASAAAAAAAATAASRRPSQYLYTMPSSTTATVAKWRAAGVVGVVGGSSGGAAPAEKKEAEDDEEAEEAPRTPRGVRFDAFANEAAAFAHEAAAGSSRRKKRKPRRQQQGRGAPSPSLSQSSTLLRLIGMPREVVISSMYLGGTGTFLAVAPLCMWDCAVTLAFLVSLLLIALLDTPPHAYRSRAYAALAGGVSLALAFAIAIEASSRLPQLASSALVADYVRLHPLFFTGSSTSTTAAAGTTTTTTNNVTTMTTPDADTEAALLLAQAGQPSLWPFLILAAASPILLRAGGGGVFVGGLFHAMTPSQTLETGLPVNGLLAGLVLSWFSPLESALAHTQNLVRHGYFAAMLLLAPAALAATLALLLHALRRRTSLISVTVLLFALMLRQQTLHRALGQHNALDVWGVSIAALSLWLAAWLVCCSAVLAGSGGDAAEEDRQHQHQYRAKDASPEPDVDSARV